MDSTIKNAWIDLDRSQYEGFYDHEWARRTLDRTDRASDLASALADLCLAWKSISNAFRYPWLLPDFHERFVTGFFESDDPFSIGFLTLFRKELVQRARETRLSEGLKLAIQVADDVRFKLVRKRKEMVRNEVADKAWDAYIDESEFRLSILGLMAQTYTGLFFAYEHFVLMCYRIATGDTKTQTNHGTFPDALANALGHSVAEQCWKGDGMRLRRELRNAFAHNGGKYNSRLDRWKSTLHIIGDEVQVSATDNRVLSSALQANVDLLVDAVNELQTSAKT